MSDVYESYADLLNHGFRENEQFTIELQLRDSKFAVIAPHGGGIEEGTTQIAKAVAGDKHTFYSFNGMMLKGNKALHISSDRFKEARAIQAAKWAETVVTIHGRNGDEEVVYLGGLDKELKSKVKRLLQEQNISVADDTKLPGELPGNICNQGKTGKGVQLEIARGLRKKLFEGLDQKGRESITEKFSKLVEAISSALD